MREIEKDRLFYDDSGGGVTFSGGEPLMQPQFLKALLDACRAREIHSVVDTSGYATPAVLARIEPDLFLFDLKMIDDGKHQKTTGVSNRRILANARALRARGVNVRLRSPLVPGVNDEDDDLRALGRVVQSLGHPEIDLLPYHRAGLAKYARLNRSYALADTPEPTAAHVERARAVLAAAGISTHVGG